MRIGIDLGGTKTEAILMDPEGVERARLRVASPRGDYAATCAAIADLVARLEAEAGTRPPVGIGMPGAISPATGLVKNANSTWLIGRPFERDLTARLGDRVRIANDADCFTLSEATDGAGAGHDVVFGVIAGTGVGGGLAVRGELVRGPNAITGEWGHTPLPWPADGERPGPACYCGRHGCIETWCSGPGLAADHVRVTGRTQTPEEIAAAATRGDAEAAATLDRHADRMARGLAVVIDVLDPGAVVLGGGLSDLAGLPDAIAARLPAHVFSDTVETRILRNRHGAASGVRGAAWLWPAP